MCMGKHASHVFILDSDPAALALCKQTLQQAGCTTQIGIAADDMLASLQERPPDLVVLDLITLLACPLKQGNALEHLRSHYPHLPILLLADSAESDHPITLAEVAATVGTGVVGLLLKPLDPDQFVAAVHSALRRQTARITHQMEPTYQRLQAMGQLLLNAPSHQRLYELLLDMVQMATQPDRVALLLHDSPAEAVRLVACRAANQPVAELVGKLVPLADSLAGQVISQKRPLLLDATNPAPPHLWDELTIHNLETALVVPLEAGGEMLGILSVGRIYTATSFTSAEQEGVQVLATFAAATLALLDSRRQLPTPTRSTPAPASPDYYQTLLDHAPDALLLFDAHARRVLDANQAAVRLSGYERPALLNLAPHQLLASLDPTGYPPEEENGLRSEPQVSKHAADELARLLVERAAPLAAQPADGALAGRQELELLLRTCSGQPISVSVMCSAVPAPGAANHPTANPAPLLLASLRDSRNRWHMARQVIQTEKLAIVGRVMSSIAHEINNPLQAIHNSLRLVTHAVNGSGEKRQRYLVLAQEEVENLIEMVRRLIDIYRPSREGMRPTNLHELLQRVIEQVEPQLHRSNIQIVCELQTDLPPVLGIASHLKQVCASLILNALEAMPDGGILTVRTTTLRGDAPDPPAPPSRHGPLAVVVELSDTGQGIPADELIHLFEPFSATRSRGTTLSLAISHGIVEQHQGQLSASSRVGQGTTFRLLLPAIG